MVEDKNKLIRPGEINSSVLVIAWWYTVHIRIRVAREKKVSDMKKLQIGHLGTGDKQTCNISQRSAVILTEAE